VLVFIDESGDPGFRERDGSSPVFVVAMVIFETTEDAQRTQDAVRAFKERHGLRGELKFNKTRNDLRDEFFRYIVNHPFIVRAIVVNKKVIYSPRLRSDKEIFYSYFVRSLMTYDADTLRNAKVIIDALGDRTFRRELAKYLKKYLPYKVRQIGFSKSHADELLQLADMCAGAIARAHRNDRANNRRWLGMLRPRVADVWPFR